MSDRSSLRARLSAVLFPAALGPAQILLFGSFSTYSRNRSEFAVSFWSLAHESLWVLGLTIVVLIMMGMLLPHWLLKKYVAALFATGVLLWLQGNLLVADYGPLYGEGLDLERHAWRAPFELAIWVGGVALAVYYSDRVITIASLASQVLLGLQGVLVLIGTVTSAPEEAGASRRWSSLPTRVHRLSHAQNVIHFVLDGYLSEIFGEILSRDRTMLDRDLSGFVFFPDHLGAFRSTKASMPAMLSGVAYRNQMPFRRFWRDIERKRSVFTTLARHRYRINSVTFHYGEHPPKSVPRTVRYSIPTPYGSYDAYVQFAAAQLFDLTLFRHVPHGLKARVYNNDAWLLQGRYEDQSRESASRKFRASNHLAFVDELTGKLIIGFDLPVYHFIHVAAPHPPVVVDSDCAFIGRQPLNRSTYAAQARCTIAVVQRFLNRLRVLGAYDRSVILLTSDHGWNVQRDDHPLRGHTTPAGPLDRIAAGAMPLLVIKPAGSSGPLRTSYAPTSLTDIPATIAALVGLRSEALPGQSVFDIDADRRRPREYAFHTWKTADWTRPYFDVLYVFSVNGRVLDPSAWRFERAIPEPGSKTEAELQRQP